MTPAPTLWIGADLGGRGNFGIAILLQEIYDTERHLLYVACTRARDHLLVTSVAPGSEFLDDMQMDGIRESRRSGARFPPSDRGPASNWSLHQTLL